MRITTQTYFNTALTGIESQRQDLSDLTRELASDRQVNKPSDDPTAYANAQRLKANTGALEQLSNDNARVSNKLGLASQSLDTALSVISNVRSVALQAANGTTNTANRAALAKQVEGAKSQLLSLANTRNAGGAYLFAGSKGDAAPFATQPNGQVIYRGDGSSEHIHSAPNQSVKSLLSGEIFSSVGRGNGYGYLTANTSNTGNAVTVLTGVTDQGAATSFRNGAAPYSISFSQGANNLNYAVKRGGSTVSSGTFSKGLTLTLGGNSVKIQGSPADGDLFTLHPSRPQSVFDTLDQLVGALKQPQSTAPQHAQSAQRLNAVLSNLDQSRTHTLSLQSTVGVALRSVKAADNANATQKTNDQQAISSALDANLPKVLTALNEHKLALSSALDAFGSLSQLSLFKYV